MVGRGVEVFTSVATVDAGSVPALMKCPFASRGLLFADSESFADVSEETGIIKVQNAK